MEKRLGKNVSSNSYLTQKNKRKNNKKLKKTINDNNFYFSMI
jgi:hypothetical protein